MRKGDAPRTDRKIEGVPLLPLPPLGSSSSELERLSSSSARGLVIEPGGDV